MKQFVIQIIKFFIEIIENIEYKNLDIDENDISKKILNTLNLDNLKIKTDTGFQEVSNIHITQPYTHYHLKTKDFELYCADNHIVFDENMNEIFVKDIKIGNLIQTKNGIQEVKFLNKNRFKSSMFDTTVNDENHRYYTNGILSHNTISSAIFILHTIIFNNDKNVMIVANQNATSVEISDKIKGIYSLLPFFLKPGIKVWNQKSMTFENGCRIKTAARSKTPAIGFTIDLLYLDEFAHIPSNIIRPYYTAVYPTVSSMTNSKIIITSTPKGMNLFYEILMDAERPEGDPLKNNYNSRRVYWYQVPGRFVSYIRLNDHLLHDNYIDKDSVLRQVKEKWDTLTNIKMIFNLDKQKHVIHIDNNEDVTIEMIRDTKILNDRGQEISLASIGEISTWKDDAIKDIGGVDAFNQEYGLRFINASESLLDEAVIEKLLENKKEYKHIEYDEFSQLRFSYKDLQWVQDDELWQPETRRNQDIILSVDLAEGLGLDYSVINIFNISAKDKEMIEKQKEKYQDIVDFFQLNQVGIYRSNVISIKQMAELLYLLAFKFFDPDRVKIVLEYNTYGSTLLAELPYVFEQNNNYGSYVFFRYKHRADAEDKKIGLRVTSAKNLLIKDYQDLLNNKSFNITHNDTINEITTFVKQETRAGNIKYAADGEGHDDCLLPDTMIKTIDGYKKIKDIKLGDLVLTHLGNYKKVTNICIKEFNGDMYKLKFSGQTYLDITYNHPIYNENNEWELPETINSCVVLKDNPIIESSNYEMNYTELFEKHESCAEKNIKVKKIIFNDDLSKLLGLFLADGNCYKPNDTTYRMSLAFNIDHKETISEMKNILNRIGIKFHIKSNKGKAFNIIFNNKTLFELLIQCYDPETKEKILPSWYKKLNNNLIFEYWLKGDGWFTRGYRMGCSTSLQLALSMRDIGLSLGYYVIINKLERHRYGVKNKDQYHLTIYDNFNKKYALKNKSSFEFKSTIKKREKYHYEGITYNLEVEDDNSYIANGIVVHNCVMTIVNATTVFKEGRFKEMVEDYMDYSLDKEMKDYINKCINSSEYMESLDYGQVLNIRNRYNSNKTAPLYDNPWKR